MFVQTHHHPSHHGVIVLAFSLLIIQFATAQQPPPPPPVLPPPPPSYTFSPSMATAVIVLIIFFFCIGFISVYVRHLMTCLGIHLGSESLGVQGWRRNRPSRGLDPAIVDNFPTFLYSDVKTHRIGKSSLECAICLNEFTDVELLRLLPSCCHVFHPHCIGPWLASHVTCPVCRANLESHSSRRSLSFNYLANNQFDQSSEDDDESSVEPSNHHNRDVIVRLGVSPQDNMAIKSPAAALQEIKRADSLTGKLPRSHSTGHSLVEDCERYTLRLPDEVRNKLVNINNSSGLPAAIVSPRVGYRARSVGCTKTDGTKPDHWRFSVSPPFISRSNSTKSPKSDSENSNNNNNNNNSGGIMSGPKSLFKSIKLSPSLNRVTRSDDTGDRSTNRLWDNRTTQDLELEAQWHQNH